MRYERDQTKTNRSLKAVATSSDKADESDASKGEREIQGIHEFVSQIRGCR